MSRPIGFSTGFFYARPIPYAERIRQCLELGLTAIEAHLSDIKDRPELLNLEAMKETEKFAYRSVHLPTYLRYPSPEFDELLPILSMFVEKINPQTLVLHPDLIDDYGWLREQFPTRLAIENMDWRKSDCRTAKELERSFTELPSAKWVCDINHAFTNDPTMALSRDLHNAYRDKLVHYHFSGFGGPDDIHTPVSSSHQDFMFEYLENTTVPIIIEGISKRDEHTLKTEYHYIKERLK